MTHILFWIWAHPHKRTTPDIGAFPGVHLPFHSKKVTSILSLPVSSAILDFTLSWFLIIHLFFWISIHVFFPVTSSRITLLVLFFPPALHVFLTTSQPARPALSYLISLCDLMTEKHMILFTWLHVWVHGRILLLKHETLEESINFA